MDVNSRSQKNKLTEQPALYSGIKSSSGAELKGSSSVSNAFTPIDRQRPMGTEHNDPHSTPLSTSQTTLRECTNVGQKRIAECSKISIEKRPKIATPSSHLTSTKQLTITPAQTPSSFRSLNVTKPMGKVQGQSLMKEHDTAPFLTPDSHRLDHQRGTQSQGSTAITIKPTDTPCSPETGLKGATEYETITDSATIMGSSDRMDCYDNGDTSWEIAGPSHNTVTNDHWSDSSDAYPLDSDIENDDLIQLLAQTLDSVEENHIPPSSIQGWDHESRSAAEYDPSLKYSPPDLEETETNTTHPGQVHSNWQTEAPEDLLDEDVDWDAVLVDMDTIQRGSSIGSRPEREIYGRGNATEHIKKPRDFEHHPNEVGPSTVFVRPPFPDKIRDRPSVPGMSSNTLLRTCFRIDMMIKQTAQCFNHKQDVVFELYARVTYSSRETLARKQHFQFVDLYKDQEPYPAATLSNWRMGSQLDKYSSVFLDTGSGPRLCRCMCKPMRDAKAAIGWTYTVLDIREIDFEQLHWAQRIICADSEQPSSEIVAAKL